ncbi:MAG: restriction endonuclease subunit S [Isosphaeraceae bacterium]
MIDELKPYPSYKTTNLPWLQKIPTTWAVCRNGRLFAQRNETGFPDLPIMEVSLNSGVRVRDFESSKRKQVMSDREKYKRARPGDIAYNMMRMWQGAVGVPCVDGLVSPAYVVARPFPETNSRYFELLFRTGVYMHEVNQASRGIVSDRNRLYWEDFKQLPSPCPPPEEQAIIVRFLDHTDRLIRRHIRSKKKLVGLLNEQKQAVIHHAVTRGLDPDAKLKPSGVEWLEDIPSHWTVASLRFRYDQCLGKMVDAKKATGEHPIPYLRNIDVRWDSINTQDLPLIDITPHERERFTVKTGDLLACEGRHLGRCAFWDGQIEVCGFQKALHRLRPLNPTTDNPRFLFYCLYLAHVKDALGASSTDNSIPHLTGEMLRAHRFAFPPMSEQTAISGYLDHTLAIIKKAVTTVQAQITLCLEYRTRLIADVITGKLDVVQAAARLPEEDEAPETIENTENFVESDEEPEDTNLEESMSEVKTCPGSNN